MAFSADYSTLPEIQAAWQRWMHRTDIAADQDQITKFAFGRVEADALRKIGPDETEEEWVTWYGEALFHAGMIYLQELVRDSEGVQMEQALYGNIMQAAVLQYSIYYVDPTMKRA